MVVAGILILFPGHPLAFDCARIKCPKIKSCAEADYKFKVCGHGERDADEDGIPCEDLCGKDMATYAARVKAQTPGETPTDSVKKPPISALGLVGPAEAAEGKSNDATRQFTCAGKRKCAQMLSCEEAKFYLASCGVASLDRDGDGVACNSLCR